MKVKAKLKNLRVSPRKVRISTDIIRGCSVDEAIFRLENTIKKSNNPIKNLLESAIANAENNFNLSRASLIVSDIQVGEGVTMKRWMPRAYGRASEILKRSSHVYIILEGEEEAGAKKKKKAVKKGAVAKDAVVEKSEEITDGTEIKKESVLKGAKKGHYVAGGNKKETKEKGWNKTMFKRKSI